MVCVETSERKISTFINDLFIPINCCMQWEYNISEHCSHSLQTPLPQRLQAWGDSAICHYSFPLCPHETSNKPFSIQTRHWALECGGIKRITGWKKTANLTACAVQMDTGGDLHKTTICTYHKTQEKHFLFMPLKTTSGGTDSLQIGILSCLQHGHNHAGLYNDLIWFTSSCLRFN